MQMEVKLTEKEVQEAVGFYLKEKFGMDVKNVKLVVGNVSSGYGPTETMGPGFQHAKCEVENNIKK